MLSRCWGWHCCWLRPRVWMEQPLARTSSGWLLTTWATMCVQTCSFARVCACRHARQCAGRHARLCACRRAHMCVSRCAHPCLEICSRLCLCLAWGVIVALVAIGIQRWVGVDRLCVCARVCISCDCMQVCLWSRCGGGSASPSRSCAQSRDPSTTQCPDPWPHPCVLPD